MSRKLWTAAALAVAALLLAGRSWSVNKPEEPKHRSRVAVFNINYVVKYYHKYRDYADELKASLAKYQANDTKWREQSEKLAKEHKQGGVTAERREQIEEELRELGRKLEANKRAAQKVLKAKNDGAMKECYRDVQKAAAKYAKDRGLELVLHYHEPVTDGELTSPENYARKLNLGAMMPVYWADGTDISQELVKALNKGEKKKPKKAE